MFVIGAGIIILKSQLKQQVTEAACVDFSGLSHGFVDRRRSKARSMSFRVSQFSNNIKVN